MHLPRTSPPEAESSLTCVGTACWPCRQRKVKCDNKHPCENCVKRDHASLCSYNPKQNAIKATAAPVAGIKRGRSPGSENSSRKEEDRWPRTTGEHTIPITDISDALGVEILFLSGEGSGTLIQCRGARAFTPDHSKASFDKRSCLQQCYPVVCTTIPELLRGFEANDNSDDDDPNESRYLGQNSIAAFLSEEATAGQPPGDGEQDVIRKDIMPILGLQISTSSYPFMSKEHMDKIKDDIAVALPPDRDVLK